MDISLVPPQAVGFVLPHLMPYLVLSAKHTRGRADEKDIISFVTSGQMQLWVVIDGSHIHGHVITEIKQYPKCKLLVIQYCAMTTGVMAAVEDKMQDIASRFAKDAGCAGIEFVGRPGWRLTARKYGYNQHSVVYQKFFKEPENG